MSSRSRRYLVAVSLFVAGIVAAGAVAWAVAAVTEPAADPLETTDFTLVEVTSGEVGSSIQLNSVAEWTPEPAGANRAAGVVTGVQVEAGAEVAQGSVLYTVDLRPVVIAQGNVPAFRDIGDRSVGADVRQVQQMLTDLGFYRGEIGGEAGAMTVAAIKAWQKSLGVDQTGVVGAGDVIFVPTLPTRVALDPELIRRGASMTGGEQVLSALPASPDFTIPVTDAQAGMIPAGTRVEITSPDGDVWTGFTGEQTRDADTGTITLALSGEDGAAICGDQCSQVPVTGQASLASKIVTVETVDGLVVPSSALVTGADGQLAVIDETGGRLPVTVTTSARGMSVIDGVDVGTKVRVPGQAK
ncbi:peptidoglycan-binding domain-containing protein [Microbacterium flavum]|uniref:peptidoglycan-binding domain-containing protein n=1 Tax=Microbacterium flavum TaxID=415216 RepID=UPI0024ACC790|nr:peptidoglycan-binding domain-containing protein [Microbacterium flavum]